MRLVLVPSDMRLFAMVLVAVPCGACSGTLASAESTPNDVEIPAVADTLVAYDAPPPVDTSKPEPDAGSLAACWIDGVAFLHADAKPKSGCQYCDEATPGAWTNRPNGVGCDPHGVCIDGACTAGCLIAEELVAVGTADPTNPCRVCAPLVSGTEFSPTPGDPPCGENGVCHAGTCTLPPTLLELSPSCGSTEGGTPITLTATGFVADVSLTLDGAAVSDLTAADAETLEGKTPPGSPGPAEAVLTNVLGQAVLSGAFHYFVDAEFAGADVRGLDQDASELATGDFDADGLEDIVYLERPSFWSATKDIVVEKGTVAGPLAEPVHHESGPVQSLSVGDLDADGADDVVATMVNAYRVLKGVPGGGLVPQEIVDLPLLYLAGPGALGRVDDDAHLDLVVGCHDQPCGAVFLGNGDGTFGQPLAFPATVEIDAVALGDLDADGQTDLVTSNLGSPGQLVTWLGQGDGTFSLAASIATHFAHGVRTADFDNDGDDDVLVITFFEGTLAQILRSTTAGNLGNPENVSPFAEAVLPADMNGDGWVDVISHGISGLKVYLNDGDATFPCQVSLPLGGYLHSDGVAAPRFGSDRPSLVVLTDTSPGSARVLFRSVPAQSGAGL